MFKFPTQIFKETRQISAKKEKLQTEYLLALANSNRSLLSTLESTITYSDKAYTRFLLHKDICTQWLSYGWKQGQASPVHGHDNSIGLMFVCRGAIQNDSFSRKNGQLQLLDCSLLTEGSILVLPRYAIHRVTGISPLAASIHLYTPSLPTKLPVYQ